MTRHAYIFALIIVLIGWFGGVYWAFYEDAENLRVKLAKRDWELMRANDALVNNGHEIKNLERSLAVCRRNR